MNPSNLPDAEEIQRLRDAADWVVRLHESSDPAMVDDWCAPHSLNRSALTRMQAVWDAFGPLQRQPTPAPSRAARPRALLRVASCLAALVALGTWLLLGSFASRTLVAAPGAPSHFLLPDGTQLDLAPESRASLRFSPLQREVRLEQGRAYFSVAPGGRRPFVAVLGGLIATGTGAAFDASIGASGAVVAVSRGHVRVQLAGLRTPVPVYAGAGQQVHYSSEVPCCTVTALAPLVAGSWRSGVLQYIDAPLSEVVAEVNGYVKHRIVLGPAGRETRFTGTVAPAHVDEFLEALRQIYPFLTLKEDAGVPVTH